MIQFPDISHYQAGLSLKGAPAVFAKATQGSTYRDPAYAGFKAQAKAFGIPFAAYHWPDASDLAAQARNAFAVIGSSTAVMWDAEAAGATVPRLLELTTRFRALGGNPRLVYLPHWWWQQIGSPDLRPLAAAGLSLVSSSYPSAGYTAAGPGWAAYGGVAPLIWQYSDKQAFGGQRVDFNAYKGTAAQLAALLGGSTEEDGMALPQKTLDDMAYTLLDGGDHKTVHVRLEELSQAVAKLSAPQVNVDLGELASQVLANAGFADAIASAVADKLAARLAQ